MHSLATKSHGATTTATSSSPDSTATGEAPMQDSTDATQEHHESNISPNKRKSPPKLPRRPPSLRHVLQKSGRMDLHPSQNSKDEKRRNTLSLSTHRLNAFQDQIQSAPSEVEHSTFSPNLASNNSSVQKQKRRHTMLPGSLRQHTFENDTLLLMANDSTPKPLLEKMDSIQKLEDLPVMFFKKSSTKKTNSPSSPTTTSSTIIDEETTQSESAPASSTPSTDAPSSTPNRVNNPDSLEESQKIGSLGKNETADSSNIVPSSDHSSSFTDSESSLSSAELAKMEYFLPHTDDTAPAQAASTLPSELPLPAAAMAAMKSSSLVHPSGESTNIKEKDNHTGIDHNKQVPSASSGSPAVSDNNHSEDTSSATNLSSKYVEYLQLQKEIKQMKQNLNTQKDEAAKELQFLEKIEQQELTRKRMQEQAIIEQKLSQEVRMLEQLVEQRRQQKKARKEWMLSEEGKMQKRRVILEEKQQEIQKLHNETEKLTEMLHLERQRKCHDLFHYIFPIQSKEQTGGLRKILGMTIYRGETLLSGNDTSTALGCVAHAMFLLSEIYAIPLLHEIRFQSSHSMIYDSSPQQAQTNQANQGAGGTSSQWLPLYSTSAKEKPRFLRAVQLLLANVKHFSGCVGAPRELSHDILEHMYQLQIHLLRIQNNKRPLR